MDSDNSSENTELCETIERWDNYRNNIDTQITNMWNFMIYNQFNNEEIRRLHRKNKNLIEDLERTNDEYDEIIKKYDNVRRDNKYLKRQIKRYEDDEEERSRKKRKIEHVVERSLLENEFDEHDNVEYVFMSNEERNNYASRIYKNINSINDIVKLKDNVNKFDFINDAKFIKLYNLIPALEELNCIIGMEEVKETIFKSICYFLHGLHNSTELNHVMITGPPGVGKTTIAKIIGKIYVKLGFLKNKKFITARRSDLIANYLGQTAIKTQKVIDRALGGVLFIDEVYSLGNKEQRDSFAKECIDTLNQNMTRDEPWLLIVGGYKEEIENAFLAYNKGLDRRFTVRLNIDGYNAEELYKILLKFIKDDGWNVIEDAITVEDIEKNIKLFKFFAGDMQKIFQKAKQIYSIRLMQHSLTLNDNSKNSLVLTRNDIITSIDSIVYTNNNMNDHVKNYMYI